MNVWVTMCTKLATILVVLVSAAMRCSASGSVEEMPDKIETWGSPMINTPCSKDYDLLNQRIIIYWKKNGDSIVTRYDGSVVYIGANSNSTKLNDDGSLSLRSDYRAEGTYECTHARPNKSFAKTRTRVIVLEPPLQALECNTTDANKSAHCQIIVPNGTETLTFTLIKGGVNATSNVAFKVDQSPDIRVEEGMPMNKTDNDDGSITVTRMYTIDVTDLGATANIQFMLVVDQRTEEFHVVLMKAKKKTGDGPRISSGQTVGIVFGVIAMIAIACLIAFVVRKRNH